MLIKTTCALPRPVPHLKEPEQNLKMPESAILACGGLGEMWGCVTHYVDLCCDGIGLTRHRAGGNKGSCSSLNSEPVDTAVGTQVDWTGLGFGKTVETGR
jgi:hypothetical protein